MALLLSASLGAQDPWSRADTYREAACAAVAVADWGQTLDVRDGATAGRGCYERNPLLGRCPSRAAVNAYFAASVALHVLVSRLLPAEWRRAFQYVTLGWEAGIVAHNYSVGFQIRF